MTNTAEFHADAGQELPRGAGDREGGRPTYIAGDPMSRGRSWLGRDYYQDDPRSKSPILATLMSLGPGLGQVYLGYYHLGFIHILIVASLITLLNRGMGDLQPFCGILLAFFWLYNLVDAGRRAVLYNHALVGLDPSELPERISAVPGRGSVIGGIILMAAGGLILAHTRFGYSLEWLEQWWPLAFIFMGGYLVYTAVADGKKD